MSERVRKGEMFEGRVVERIGGGRGICNSVAGFMDQQGQGVEKSAQMSIESREIR